MPVICNRTRMNWNVGSFIQMVILVFLSTVAPVRAAAGSQAVSPLRPAGPPKEEAAACRALHHQRYIYTSTIRTLIELFEFIHFIFLLLPSLKSRGTSAAWPHQQGTPPSTGRMESSKQPSRFPSNVRSLSDEYNFQHGGMTANMYRWDGCGKT